MLGTLMENSADTMRAQQAALTSRLAESERANAWLRLAEQVARVGHWRIELPAHAVTWSDETYRIHGVTPQTHRPDYFAMIGFCHPDDRAPLRDLLERAARTGESFDVLLRLVLRDGALRHVLCRGETICGPDNGPSSVFGILIDVTEQQRTEQGLRAANKQLDEIAYVDGMTGIANRRKFDESLEREWRAAVRSGNSLSIIMIDVDRFKLFNDKYGHQAGDECLRAVAGALRSATRRAYDLVARYGGEEFVLLLPATEAEGAMRVAEQARRGIEALALAHDGNAGCGGIVTVSAGVATVTPTPGAGQSDSQSLLTQADEMLYEAKRTGRNRAVSVAVIARQALAASSSAEDARLAALESYDRRGATRRTAELDRIARIAAALLGTPVGLVSLVGREKQRFAGNFGLDGIDGTPRDQAFCAHTILGEDPMVVADATRDERFKQNALVTGDLGLRYYAGAPIVSKGTGHRLGSLCVIDKSARETTSPAQRAVLADLANMAAILIEEAAGGS